MNDVREPRGKTLCKKLMDQFEIIRNLIVESGTNYKSWVWPALPSDPWELCGTVRAPFIS